MDLVVRVRASGDSSLTSVFRPLLAASAAASKGIEAQLAGIGKAAARGAEVGAAAHRKAGKEGESVYRKLGTAAEEWARKSEKAQDTAHKKALANLKELEREQKRSFDGAQARDSKRAREVASGALRTFGGYARTGLSTLGTVAMGMGIDTSLAGGLSRGLALESAAVAIANKGNRGGAVEDPKALEALARTTGDMFKVDPTKVLAGLDKFQSLTGDLNLGKLALRDLTGLSKAFKIDLDKMIGSAGNVATKIGAVGKEFKTPEEKAKAILAVMKSLVAQGQEGAIEMPDLVTQLSALGAAAPRFEGSAAANISKMGAMAQLALQMGGAKSASQATTAVMGFANTLSTPARRAQFKAMGVDIDSTTEKGKFADPFEIIKRSLAATGGDTDKMKKLFANVVGERAVRALTNAFLGAGGGDKGLAAIDAQFARFGGTVSDKQIQENLGRELNTKASDAQAFQNELDKVTSGLGNELAPALKDLAPVALGAAKGLSGLVSFGASHPETAITAAIVGSIGKAMGGTAGATFQIAAATLVLGQMAIDSIAGGAEAGEKKSMAGEAARDNAYQSAKAALRGDKSAIAGYSDASAAVANDMKRLIKVDKLNEAGAVDMLLNTLMPTLGLNASILGLDKEAGAARDFATGAVRGMGATDIGEARADREKAPDIKADLARQSEVLSQLAPKLGELSKAASDLAAAAKSFRGGSGPGPTPNEGARSGGVN